MMGSVTFAYSSRRLDQRRGFSVETPGSKGAFSSEWGETMLFNRSFSGFRLTE